jgi:hypothetical protein
LRNVLCQRRADAAAAPPPRLAQVANALPFEVARHHGGDSPRR